MWSHTLQTAEEMAEVAEVCAGPGYGGGGGGGGGGEARLGEARMEGKGKGKGARARAGGRLKPDDRACMSLLACGFSVLPASK